MKKFNIQTIYSPDYSCKVNGNVLNYIEDLLIDHVLIPKKIIINSSWEYLFSFNVHISRSSDKIKLEKIVAYPIQQMKSEMTKISGAMCPSILFTDIKDEEKHVKDFIGCLLESLRLFFAENFKKNCSDNINIIYNSLDFDLIKKLINSKDNFLDKILYQKPLKLI
jgi:hypothetical protein